MSRCCLFFPTHYVLVSCGGVSLSTSREKYAFKLILKENPGVKSAAQQLLVKEGAKHEEFYVKQNDLAFNIAHSNHTSGRRVRLKCMSCQDPLNGEFFQF